MKTKIFLFTLALLTIVAAFFAARSQLVPAPLPPFLLTESIASLKSGNPIRHVTTRSVAVREDGSWAEISYLVDIPVRAIYDTQNGVLTTIVDESKSIQTRKMSDHMVSVKKIVPATTCGGKAAGELLGQKVEYLETSSPIDDSSRPNLTIVQFEKEWKAPTLGCTLLREERIWKGSENQTDWNLMADVIHQAISISFEPVSQFFEVPTGYTERKPSAVFQQLSLLHPDKFPTIPDTTGSDASYLQDHEAITH